MADGTPRTEGIDTAVELPQGTHLLYSAEQIAQRRRQLAAEISRDYEGKEVLLLGVLHGSVPFFVDLARELSVPVRFGFVRASSYAGGTVSSGVVEVSLELPVPLAGEHVLLVEDIVDSGRTIARLLERLHAEEPASLRVVTLLDKPSRRVVAVPIDYCGFTVPDRFIVGYGLDYAQRYRNLSCIAWLTPEGSDRDGAGDGS